jgi:cytochrome c553
VNLVLLKKDPISHNVSIEQPNISNFKGWTVEEILTDLMDLEGQTMSNTYLELMQQFEEGLDADDFEKTNHAFQELNKILHPESKQRKLLSIQMTNLSAEPVL